MRATEVEQAVLRSVRNISALARKNGAEPESRLREDLKVNSLALVALITSLSEELEVEVAAFTEMDLTGLDSVQDVVDLFRRKSAAIGEDAAA